ncbi:hypothetical protein BIW11_12665, partial [Tropilaelaps mercedesae]
LGGESGVRPVAVDWSTNDYLEYSSSPLTSHSFSLNSLTFSDGDIAFRNNVHGAAVSNIRHVSQNTQLRSNQLSHSICGGLLTAVEQTAASRSMSHDTHFPRDLDSSLPSTLSPASSVSSTTSSDFLSKQRPRPVSRDSCGGDELHSRSGSSSSISPYLQRHTIHRQKQQQQQKHPLRVNLIAGDSSLPSSSQLAVAKGLISPMVSLATTASPSGSGHHGGHRGGHHGSHGSGHHSATLAGTSQRLLRNIAEKQRRDKLNSSISELAAMVPMVGMSTKRLDKTAILRLSAAHLRFNQTQLVSQLDYPGIIQESQGGGPIRRRRRWRPEYVNQNHLRELIEALEGFVLIMNMNGKIIYVSPAVERFLGHQNLDMFGHSLFAFMHAADVENVHTKLQSLFSAKEQYRIVDDQLVCENVSFFCRIREKTQPRSQVITYQAIYVIGRIVGPARFTDESGTGPSHCTALSQPFSPSQFKLKAFVRILNASPYKELSLNDANRDEYVTRHKLDGTIIYADHRIGTVTGHLPHEVVGMLAHKYMEPSDVVIALFAQKQMLASHSGKGVVVYRLKTRGDDFIYLRTSGYLHYDQSTMQVDHFVCVNTLMSTEEGERERQELCKRFSPHITAVTVEHLNDFFSSVHTHTLRRIQRSRESAEINSNKHVPGGSACHPLALENLVEPNLFLGSNCFVKLKTENDSDDFEEISKMTFATQKERTSYVVGDKSLSECSTVSEGVQSARNTSSCSPLRRSSDSPEMSNPPLTPATSPISLDSGGSTGAEITHLNQGQFSMNVNIDQLISDQQQQNKRHELQQQPKRQNSWNACEFTMNQESLTDVVKTHHRKPSASAGGYGSLASPSSVSSPPLDDDNDHQSM